MAMEEKPAPTRRRAAHGKTTKFKENGYTFMVDCYAVRMLDIEHAHSVAINFHGSQLLSNCLFLPSEKGSIVKD